MKRSAVFISLALVAPILIGAPFHFSRAQSEEFQAARQGVSTTIDKLLGAKDNQATAAREQEELAARKNALGKVFELTLTEIKELKKKLDAINDRDLRPELLVLKTKFSDLLNSYAKEIADRVKPLSDIRFTLNDVRIIAGDFKDWRANEYDPETKVILNFLLVVQGRNILNVAENRFERIAVDVKKIENAFHLEVPVFQPYLDRSSKKLGLARRAEEGAQELFLESVNNLDNNLETSASSATPSTLQLVDFQSALTTPASSTSPLQTPAVTSSTEPGNASSSAIIIVPTPAISTPPLIPLIPVPSKTVAALIKVVFDRVSETYKIFFEMSRLAQKLLQ